MIELNFPTLQFIKRHKRHPNSKDKEDYETYEWEIFNLDRIGYCRIVYNEDDNNKLYLDLMCDGYCDRCVPPGFNKAYPVTKEGYDELQKAANRFVNNLFNFIISSNESFKNEWE